MTPQEVIDFVERQLEKINVNKEAQIQIQQMIMSVRQQLEKDKEPKKDKE